MKVVETLLPLVLLILLGLGLSRVRLLGEEAIHHLMRLVFWVTLPAFIIHSTAQVQMPAGQVLGPVLLMSGVTVLVLLIALGIAWLRRSPGPVAGSMIQSAFRGNLAFVGLPIVAYSLTDLPVEAQREALALAVVILGPLMVLYNVLSIFVLMSYQHRFGVEGLRLMGRSLVSNPLIVASFGGMLLARSGAELPVFLNRFLEALGRVSVPLALLCIGASFASLSLKGRRWALWIAVGLKVVAMPLLVLWGCQLLGFSSEQQRILLVMAACPTAAASYVMARQMGGDAELSATSIAASSLLCMIPLSVILLYT